MIYICEDIPSKLLDKHVFPNYMEGLSVESNVRKCKRLFFGTYHLPSQINIYYFDNLDKAFDTYSSHEKGLLIGDFNTEISESHIDSLLNEHELHNLVKEKTCFMSVHNPSYIDFIECYGFSEYNNSFYWFNRFS